MASPGLPRIGRGSPYGYGNNAPTVWGDPTGLIVRNPVEEYGAFMSTDSQIYTCNCGWLDHQHLIPAAVDVLATYRDLMKGATTGSIKRGDVRGYGLYWWEHTYSWQLNVPALTDAEAAIGTAELIAYDAAGGLEKAQAGSTAMETIRKSSFSLEDQPSNYIGARLAGDYLRSLEDPDQATQTALMDYIAKEVPKLCGEEAPGRATVKSGREIRKALKDKNWDVTKVRDGRHPLILPAELSCCRQAKRPEMLDRAWFNAPFRGGWQLDESLWSRWGP